MSEPTSQRVAFISLVASESKKGHVRVLVNDEIIMQIDVPTARKLVGMFQEAIEASITDEMIFKFFSETMKLDDMQCTMILADFRELRQGSKDIIFEQ